MIRERRRTDQGTAPWHPSVERATILRNFFGVELGAAGVRAELAPAQCRIMIHVDCGGDAGKTKWFFDHIQAAQLDYDIIGRGLGLMYWYPEAVLTKNIKIWNGGATATFDDNARALPSIDVLKGSRN